jgi:hypothetical protein
MSSGLRKSIYIFLSCLVGALLFMVLQRVTVFLYIGLLAYGFDGLTFGLSWIELLALDYLTLLLSLLFGGWYGIWVGLHWYESVYEHGSSKGFIGNLLHMWPRSRKTYDLQSKVAAVSTRLENDLGELQNLTTTIAERVPKTAPKKRIVKRVIRKKAPVLK